MAAIGSEIPLVEALDRLVTLEADAADAARAARFRLDDRGLRDWVAGLGDDHARRVRRLSAMSRAWGGLGEREAVGERVAKGDVLVASAISDSGVLQALALAQDGLEEGYAHALTRNDLPDDVRATLQQGRRDAHARRDALVARIEARPQRRPQGGSAR